MKSVIILFTDHGISKTQTEKAFCERFNLTLFDFMEEFRNQLRQKDDLTNELNSFINKGDLVPLHLLEEFIARQFRKITAERILVSGYPKTPEQFLSLAELLDSISFSIESIWYIKQRQPDLFFLEYLKETPGIKKYGDDFPVKWKQSFRQKQEQVERISEAAKSHQWHVVEMDYQPVVSKEYIAEQLDNN